MRRFGFWLMGILVLGGLAGGWYYFSYEKENAVQYRTVKVTKGSLSTYVTANGTVNPVTTVLVGTQVSGTIQKLYADYNTPVKEGQLIAQIDPATFQAQLAQAKAKLENARAALLNAQADISTARSNLELNKANVLKAQVSVEDTKRSLARALILFERNLISASERDAAQTAHDLALAQIEAARAQERASEAQLESAWARLESSRAQIKQAEAEVELVQVNLNHTRITAPVTGIVISRNVDVGQTVAASLQTPTLFTIAKDLTKMQVDTNVSEADIGRVRVGQPASFTVDAFPHLTFQGKVTEVRNAPVTIQNVVTYNVVIQVANPELKLKPGMTANASILVAHKDEVLKIPNAALRFRPEFAKKGADGSAKPAERDKGLAGKPAGAAAKTLEKARVAAGESQARIPTFRVWVPVPKGKPVSVEITTGISDGVYTEVLSGPLREGQEVITEAIGESRSASPSAGPLGGMRFFR